MTARLIAVGIGVLGLVVAFAWQRWPLRDVGRDVGPSVLVEDRSDDLDLLLNDRPIGGLSAAQRDGAE
jgi:hypothetical protein